MPMPHRTQMALIKRRLTGKEGAERLRELRSILAELPNYKNGPYAEIRKWVSDQIDATRARARVVHRDSIAVRREGEAQIALVGPPNAGKSSLLHALSEVQIKIGDYAFTTLRPVPALVRVDGVLVQFIEIPGLIEGASEGRGNGRALLSVLRGVDAIVYCQAATAPVDALHVVRREVALADIEVPAILAITKSDDASDAAIASVRRAFPDLPAIPVSVLDDESLEALKHAAWRLTSLIRVFVRSRGETAPTPLALPADATVLDVARSIHGDLVQGFRGARVWGASTRFEGQQVGRDHRLQEGDVVEIRT